jgi:hypothetical protein
VPVGCQQRLHQSEDDRLPNSIRQTIKNSPRIGQTICASKQRVFSDFNIFPGTGGMVNSCAGAARVRAQNKSCVGQGGAGDVRCRLAESSVNRLKVCLSVIVAEIPAEPTD